jgi:transcription initiation factor TFIID subunit 7
MLVVENRLENDEVPTTHRNFNIEEFIWPHGITPPLHHVRKRRFRKRVNRRVRCQVIINWRRQTDDSPNTQTIESVEQEVERLLEEDAAAIQVQYGERQHHQYSVIITHLTFCLNL